MQKRASAYPVDSRFAKQRVSQARRIEALGKVELFASLSKRNLGRLNDIAQITYAQQDDVIMEQGAPGDAMAIVLDGQAVVRRGTRKVGECGPGQWFGEMALFDDEPRSATIIAQSYMRLLEIPGAEFRKLLPKLPGVAEALLAELSKRLREANAVADF